MLKDGFNGLVRCIVVTAFLCSVCSLSATADEIPAIAGEPIIVTHVGSVKWPQDSTTTVPFLTQGDSNALNDMHGDVACDINISTPGNYHMALRDAMYGRSDLDHIGLVERVKSLYGVTVCWTTSPPINEEQIPLKSVQFGNANLRGLPALAMAPGAKMKHLEKMGYVDPTTRQTFLVNRGNVMLVRADRISRVKDICSFANPSVRLVTPRPPGSEAAEPGSFGNFSATLFNVINQNTDLPCHPDAVTIFEKIFGQDLSAIDTGGLDNPFDHIALDNVYHSSGVRWVASSRIMHRDIPYALCNDYADVAIIFFHQAVYLKNTMASLGCQLEIVPFKPGSRVPETTLSGNKIGRLFIAKVNGGFSKDIRKGRDLIYDFLTASPVWTRILTDHELDDPTP